MRRRGDGEKKGGRKWCNFKKDTRLTLFQLAFCHCVKTHVQKQLGEEKVFWLTVSQSLKEVMAGNEGRNLGAEAVEKHCKLACFP